MDTLLFGSAEEEPNVPENVLQNLLLKPEELAQSAGTEPVSKIVIPEAGFCLKTKTEKGDKVFINICKSDQIPSPKDITDEQLEVLQESGDASHYRVPLSLGEPHTVTDNVGKECQAYDIIISTNFFDTIQSRLKMKQFLLTLVLEGLEDKYDMRLSRDCKIMKNRKFIGSLPEQEVRKKSKPFIVEVDKDSKPVYKSGKKVLTTETSQDHSSSAPEPQFTIVREPVEGEVPDFLVLEIQLPGINSSRNISFEVGEDRLVLKTRPNLFYLDVDLPYLVNNEETGAQFDRERKVLTATLAVTGKYKRHHCDPA